MATTNLMPDDRRSLTIRLSVIQYLDRGGVRRAGGRVLDLPDRPAREVPRDRGEQPPAQAAAAGAARRAARSRRQGPGREPEHAQHRAGPRADARTSATCCACSRPRPASTRRSCATRSTGAGASRPTARSSSIENATREQVIAVWARRLELPGIIYQEVPSRQLPGERHGGAPVRLRRRGHRERSSSAPTTRGSSPARWSGRPASSSPTTRS